MRYLIRLDTFVIAIIQLIISSFAIGHMSSFSEGIVLVMFSTAICFLTIYYYNNSRVGMTYFFLWLSPVYLIGFVRLKYWNYFSSDVLSVFILWLFAFVVFFVSIYSIMPTLNAGKRNRRIVNKLNTIYQSRSFLYITFLLYMAFIGIQVTLAGSLSTFLTYSYAERNDPNSAYLLFILRILRSSLMISCYSNLFLYKKPLFPIIILSLVLALSNIEGDTGLMLTILLPLLVYLILKNLEKLEFVRLNWIITVALLVSVVVMSFTAQVRVERSGSESFSSLIYGRTFDALENSIRIVEKYEPGSQLGTNIIIYPLTNFVPRSLWTNKPIGLGRRIMFDIYGEPMNTSVSFAPGLIGEFYVDFGYYGIFIFGFLFAFIIKNIDYAILIALKKGEKGLISYLIYVALLSGSIPNSPQGYLLQLVVIGIFQIIFVLVIGWFMSKVPILHSRSARI